MAEMLRMRKYLKKKRMPAHGGVGKTKMAFDLARREETFNTDEVLEMFPQIQKKTLQRWIKTGQILEPVRNVQTRERVWTRVELNCLVEYLVSRNLTRRVA